MTRVILTVGCVGKTYIDKNYYNVYDFDKHTLDYKYDRKGFEHLSNEEFKGIPNRKINDGWFERYMEDWCSVIDSDNYDVVTGWLQEDCLNYLVDKGYNVEVVVVNVGDDEYIYKERSQLRGNNDTYWENLRYYYDKTLELYKNRTDIKVTIFDRLYYLSEYLTFSGVILKHINGFYDTYVSKIAEKIENTFIGYNTVLPVDFVPFYTQLVLTSLSSNIKITDEMVHDAWSVSTYNRNKTAFHKSIIPFNYLDKNIQELDKLYTDKLNEVLVYFNGLKQLAEASYDNK